MVENYSWLALLWVINSVDYIVMYMMAHNIGGHQLENKIKHQLLLLSFGVITGTLVYFFNDGILLRLPTMTLSLITIKVVTMRKTFDIFLIYAIAFLLMIAVQLLTLWPIVLWEVSDAITFLGGQSLILTVVIILCWKVSFYEIFLLIKQKLALTTAVILLFAIIYALLIIFEFDIHSTFEQMLLFGALIITTLTVFFAILIMSQTRINQVSDKYHDLVNKFTGLYLAIEANEDQEKIKALSREMRKYVTGKAQVKPLTDNHEVNFAKILHDKIVDSGKNNKLILDIGYHEHHKIVSLGEVTYMLGSLFDNALDHGLDQPIFVYLNVCENLFELTVKNSCKEIPHKKMTKLFKKGFTTKEQMGHGQGLHKLKQEVEAYNKQCIKAEIAATTYYDLQYDCHYLEMVIEISA